MLPVASSYSCGSCGMSVDDPSTVYKFMYHMGMKGNEKKMVA